MLAAASELERGLGRRYVEEVETLVGRGLMDEALKRVQDCVRDLAPGLKRDTLVLCARYNEFKSARRRGLIKSVETDPAIVEAILQLASDATEQGAIQPRLHIEPGARHSSITEHAQPLAALADTTTTAAVRSQSGAGNERAAPTNRPLAMGTVHPFPVSVAREKDGESLAEFRKAYWRRFGRSTPPEKSVACIADGISRSYRGSTFNLEPLSFTLRAGEITGVVGRNAAGKTTLLRMVLGELAPHTGRISYPMLTVGGTSWVHIKSQIAYLPQLPPRWRGRLRENLNFAASLAGAKGRANKELVEWNMQRYGLAGYADYLWEEISGGYKIRFELAKALVSKPRLLVLDEPLAHLDVMGRQEFLSNLSAVSTSFEQPVPIIITSQHLYEIEAVADQMIILDGGSCIYSGPLDGIESQVPHRRIELSMRLSAKAVEAALRPHGAVGLEPTMEGYIVSFPKEMSAAALFETLGRLFGSSLTAIRDITGSARSLFKEELDHLPPMEGGTQGSGT